MQCLIVAAGKGLRLRARGQSKPLVELAGKPLIQHVIENAVLGGVTDFVIVTGYEAETLEGFLADFQKDKPFSITFVRNKDYELPNGLSVFAAKDVLAPQFLLAMCDHLMEPGMVRAMASQDPMDGTVLGVDRELENQFVDLEDVTMVKTEGDLIQAIGKGIPAYDCFDTGIFKSSHALLDAIQKSGEEDDDWSISGGMLRLANAGKARVHEVTGNTWIDVDSPEMFEMAETYLAEKA